MTTRVVVGGMHNAGKSTLACSLAETLRARGSKVELIELDPYSDTHACILGRKPWSERQKVANPAVMEFLRRNKRFRESPAEFVIGDLPGRIHAKNRLLVKGADCALLVIRKPLPTDRPHVPELAETDVNHHDPTPDQWREYFSEEGIAVAATVYSLGRGEVPPQHDAFVVPDLDLRNVVFNSGLMKLASAFIATTGRVPV